MSPIPLSSVVMAHLRSLLKAGCDRAGYCFYCHTDLSSKTPHFADCPYRLACEFIDEVDG
jgi:hypothetical protein